MSDAPSCRNIQFNSRAGSSHGRLIAQSAQQTLESATLASLSTRDRDQFLDLIESDAKPNHALIKAAACYKKRRA